MKPIPGFHDYKINKQGVITKKNGEALKPYNHPDGYPVASLKTPEGEHVCRFVHRLVLATFVGPCPPRKQCAHLDGNPKNCSLQNLAWVTCKENMNHKRLHGTHQEGPSSSNAKFSAKDIIEIRRLYRRDRNNCSNAKMLAERFSVNKSTIVRIVFGRTYGSVKEPK